MAMNLTISVHFIQMFTKYFTPIHLEFGFLGSNFYWFMCFSETFLWYIKFIVLKSNTRLILRFKLIVRMKILGLLSK